MADHTYVYQEDIKTDSYKQNQKYYNIFNSMNRTNKLLSSVGDTWEFILDPDNFCYVYYCDFKNPDKTEFSDDEWIFVNDMSSSMLQELYEKLQEVFKEDSFIKFN